MQDHGGSQPAFAVGISVLTALSQPLQPSFRFFHLPLPVALSVRLTTYLPWKAKHRVYRVPRDTHDRLGSLCSPGVSVLFRRSTVGETTTPTLTPLPFWLQRLATPSAGSHDDVYQAFTYVNHTVNPGPIPTARSGTIIPRGRWSGLLPSVLCPRGFIKDRYQSPMPS